MTCTCSFWLECGDSGQRLCFGDPTIYNLFLCPVIPSFRVLEVLLKPPACHCTARKPGSPWKPTEVAAGISNSFRVKLRGRREVPGSRKKTSRVWSQSGGTCPELLLGRHPASAPGRPEEGNRGLAGQSPRGLVQAAEPLGRSQSFTW